GALQRANRTTFANRSRVRTAGAGKSVRGRHPDILIGDDVLTEMDAKSLIEREAKKRWWKATVEGMTHPGTPRWVAGYGRIWFPPTRVYLVGTPFHAEDLLMSMRENPVYAFARYAAEFDPAE